MVPATLRMLYCQSGARGERWVQGPLLYDSEAGHRTSLRNIS